MNEPVTRGMLDEAVGAILEGMDKMFRTLKGYLDEGFEKVDKHLEKEEKGI
jgi:hypothetical protein